MVQRLFISEPLQNAPPPAPPSPDRNLASSSREFLTVSASCFLEVSFASRPRFAGEIPLCVLSCLLLFLTSHAHALLVQLHIMQMHFLVYTPKGNIETVGNHLLHNNLKLEHPTPPFDNECRLHLYPYFNPHNPPPGVDIRRILNRYYAPGLAIGKTQDIQRTQIDELFKNLKDGVELPETEPGTIHHFHKNSNCSSSSC